MTTLITPHPRDYSLVRLIRSLSERSVECPELAYSRSVLEAEYGRPSRGSFLPPLRPQATGLSTLTDASGGYLKGQNVSADIVIALRANSVLARAGAQTLTDLNQGLAIVVQKNGTGVSWTGEDPGSDAAGSIIVPPTYFLLKKLKIYFNS